MIDKQYATEVLLGFLAKPLDSARTVLEEFAALAGARYYEEGRAYRHVYIPGTRPDRVLLVAHADTVWDGQVKIKQTPVLRDGVIRGEDRTVGLGADDRAGCAILWLLRESGHSLLVLDGEEYGSVAAHHIEEELPELFAELNAHAYVVEVDRRQDRNYKVYDLPVTQEFRAFIEDATGYREADRRSSTDIRVLCRDICGVNLSIGYYNEHTEEEYLVVDEWYRTLTLLEAMLAPPQRKYLLEG